MTDHDKVYTLTYPDGLVIKYLWNGLHRFGFIHPHMNDDYIFVHYPEAESRYRFLQDVGIGDVVIDIGACAGSWSIHAALKGAYVHAFEFAEPQLKTLEYNIKLNNVSKLIDIHKIAIGSGYNTLMFDQVMRLYPKDLVASTSVLQESINTSIITRAIELKEITTVPLDDWIRNNEYRWISLIKIDVEGMELDVLKGAYNTLREYKPKLVIEVHDDESPHLRHDIESLLKDLGYEHKRIPGLNDYFF